MPGSSFYYIRHSRRPPRPNGSTMPVVTSDAVPPPAMLSLTNVEDKEEHAKHGGEGIIMSPAVKCAACPIC